MASPQLGGAASFFSDAARPGVHVKGWKAAGIVDKRRGVQSAGGGGGGGENLGLAPELRLKSLSTNDLSYLAAPMGSPPAPNSHPPPHTPSSLSSHRHRRGPRRGKGIHSRLSNLATGGNTADANGMNTLPDVTGNGSHDKESGSHDRETRSHDQGVTSPRGGRRGSQAKGEGEEKANTSLLQQVGNFFGWSGLGFGGGGGGGRGSEGEGRQTQTENGGAEDGVDFPADSVGSDTGLAGIL